MPSAETSDKKADGRDLSSAWSESRQAKAEADRLAEAIRRARVEWEELLRQRLKQRPYATIAAAVGVGYVVGGGLAPHVIRSVVGIGGRMAAGVLMQRLLATPLAGSFSSNGSTLPETE